MSFSCTALKGSKTGSENGWERRNFVAQLVLIMQDLTAQRICKGNKIKTKCSLLKASLWHPCVLTKIWILLCLVRYTLKYISCLEAGSIKVSHFYESWPLSMKSLFPNHPGPVKWHNSECRSHVGSRKTIQNSGCCHVKLAGQETQPFQASDQHICPSPGHHVRPQQIIIRKPFSVRLGGRFWLCQFSRDTFIPGELYWQEGTSIHWGSAMSKYRHSLQYF